MVVGKERERFPLVGRGSARVFSPPIAPQIINGMPYIALDMGVESQRIPECRTVADEPLRDQRRTRLAPHGCFRARYLADPVG